MTKSEFIQESLSFPEGSMVVVSGKDISEVEQLLSDARTEIEGNANKQVLVFNSRDEIVYAQRFYRENTEQARLWEFVALLAEDDFVVLIANEFDRKDTTGGRRPRSIAIDTMLDLMEATRVIEIESSHSRHRTGPTRRGIRELFPHISRVYHFDTDEDDIVFVTSQIPDRP